MCDALPLSRFPEGESRGGRETPRRKQQRLPLQEGFQNVLLKTPLLSPMSKPRRTKSAIGLHMAEQGKGRGAPLNALCVLRNGGQLGFVLGSMFKGDQPTLSICCITRATKSQQHIAQVELIQRVMLANSFAQHFGIHVAWIAMDIAFLSKQILGLASQTSDSRNTFLPFRIRLVLSETEGARYGSKS